MGNDLIKVLVGDTQIYISKNVTKFKSKITVEDQKTEFCKCVLSLVK